MTNQIRLGMIAAGLAGVVYGGFFLRAGLTSQEEVLPAGTPYHFCGFYLDCHLSVAVEGVTVTPTSAGGERYSVLIRFASDAHRAVVVLDRPVANLVDDMGTRVESVAGPTGARLSPDSSVSAEFVFEVAAPLVNPRLHVVKGSRMERWTERLLIGDPDSFFHPPVTLALR